MSNLLTARELARLQDDIEDTLPDLCNMGTFTNTSDGQGGFTQTKGTTAYDVPCRLDMQSAREALIAGAVQPYARYIMTLPHDKTITNNYWIEHNTKTYNVIGVALDPSWPVCVRAILEAV